MPERDLPDFDLAAFLPYRLAVAAAQVSRAFSARYRAQFGLTIPEWRVLAHLARGTAVSVRDIHEQVQMDKPKISRAASALEQAGLVAKVGHATDGRLVALSLTPKGRALVARLIPMALDYQAALVASLGDRATGLDAGLRAITEDRV
jgi:DNA-binding MarR family transcriptional regulator